MHQFDQFKQDMEKLNRADLTNPIKRSKSELYRSNRADVSNLYRYESSETVEHCTVLTLDGIDGFAWYDPATGQRHDEGFTWPTMQIHKDATVEVLFGPDGERSAGWRKSD